MTVFEIARSRVLAQDVGEGGAILYLTNPGAICRLGGSGNKAPILLRLATLVEPTRSAISYFKPAPPCLLLWSHFMFINQSNQPLPISCPRCGYKTQKTLA